MNENRIMKHIIGLITLFILISLFYDNNAKQWLISTKSSIGGKYWFYGKISSDKVTFYQMFMESLKASPNDSLNDSLNDLEIIKLLPKNYCYNFIMQHPSNIITIPIERPKLYLISIYELNKNIVEYIPAPIYQSWNIFRNIEGIIDFPRQYHFNDYSEISNSYNNSILPIGFIITNINTGEKTKFMNERFDRIKRILYIKPTIQYQFLCLYRIGRDKIDEYLSYFPAMKKDFYLLRSEYEEFIKEIYKIYLDVYVRKYDIIIDEKYSSHIYKIHHEIYLASLNTKNHIIIKYGTVLEYFSKMEPRELLYLLNWDKRKLKL
jgi:hypothetical protein